MHASPTDRALAVLASTTLSCGSSIPAARWLEHSARGYVRKVTSGRVNTALVYFGLREDDEVRERLEAGPMNAWRVLAVAVALLLGLALAFGVLWLVGVVVTWRTAYQAVVVFGLVSTVAVVASRLRQRRAAD
jgi:hypothetical protein